MRCIQNYLNGQAQLGRDVISGTKAILKKVLQCTPRFRTGAPAVEHLHQSPGQWGRVYRLQVWR